MNSFTSYMGIALGEAKEAANRGEVPVGAVIIAGGQVIAKAGNRTRELHDPTAHAEMLAIRAACASMGQERLSGCDLYVTLEPCAMCAGALNWAKIDTIYYGASDVKRGFSLIDKNILHPKTKINTGIMALESQKLLEDFFKKLREE